MRRIQRLKPALRPALAPTIALSLVTALPADPSHVIDTRFVCENPDCDAFGDAVES